MSTPVPNAWAKGKPLSEVLKANGATKGPAGATKKIDASSTPVNDHPRPQPSPTPTEAASATVAPVAATESNATKAEQRLEVPAVPHTAKQATPRSHTTILGTPPRSPGPKVSQTLQEIPPPTQHHDAVPHAAQQTHFSSTTENPVQRHTSGNGHHQPLPLDDVVGFVEAYPPSPRGGAHVATFATQAEDVALPDGWEVSPNYTFGTQQHHDTTTTSQPLVMGTGHETLASVGHEFSADTPSYVPQHHPHTLPQRHEYYNPQSQNRVDPRKLQHHPQMHHIQQQAAPQQPQVPMQPIATTHTPIPQAQAGAGQRVSGQQPHPSVPSQHSGAQRPYAEPYLPRHPQPYGAAPFLGNWNAYSGAPMHQPHVSQSQPMMRGTRSVFTQQQRQTQYYPPPVYEGTYGAGQTQYMPPPLGGPVHGGYGGTYNYQHHYQHSPYSGSGAPPPETGYTS